jgi:plasmid stability protein
MGQKALNIRNFPEDLKFELKMVALKKRISLRDLIIEVLTAYIEKERG